MMMRLHKFLARAGVDSRRACEALIAEGQVTVDGKVVTQLGIKVDPDIQDIRVKDEPVKEERKAYFVFNKPRGVICTSKDVPGHHRPKVTEFFSFVKQRLFTIGRLDVDSQGLLIVTNDGDLCNLLTHPRYEVPKTYHATIKGYLAPVQSERVQKGIWLAEGKTSRSKLRIIKRSKDFTVLTITLKEGKNREVRRIFARLGHPVMRLTRISIGKLSLSGLNAGQFMQISKDDLVRKLGVTLLAEKQAKLP